MQPRDLSAFMRLVIVTVEYLILKYEKHTREILISSDR